MDEAEEYAVLERLPTPDEFVALREAAGMTPRSREGVERGLPNSLFAVVVRQYTAHPDNIFKESVIQRTVEDYHCFLMTDQNAVEGAVDDGATRLTATDLANPFE